MPSAASLLVWAARDSSRAARAARSAARAASRAVRSAAAAAAAAAASSRSARPSAPGAASFGPHWDGLGGDSCSNRWGSPGSKASFGNIDSCSDPVSPDQFSGVSSPGTSNSIVLCFIKEDLMPLYSIVGRIGPRLSISFRSE